MPYSIHRSGRPCAGRSAFTLIELLIVVGIITILIVLGMSVAGKVSGGGKVTVTKDTLKNLDAALSAFIAETGGNPPAWVIDPRPTNNMSRIIQPVLDGRCGSTNEVVNSVGFFMVQCKSVPSASAALKQLDSKYLREYTPDTGGTGGPPFDLQPSIPTAFDGWGRPIRYVHPQFKGTIWQNSPTTPPTGFVDVGTIVPPPPGKLYGVVQVRRNNAATAGPVPSDQPDSDGGINPASRPYFYSVGPDGDPSTIADNIYLSVPRVAKN